MLSLDPKLEAEIREFFKKPLREQLDELVVAQVQGYSTTKPWLVREVLTTRVLILSSHRLERLTGWLLVLTVVLAVLTAVLAFDVIRHLFGA